MAKDSEEGLCQKQGKEEKDFTPLFCQDHKQDLKITIQTLEALKITFQCNSIINTDMGFSNAMN